MYKIKKVKKQSIVEMTELYHQYVTAPMDDMWELGIIANGDFYTIAKENAIGYFVVDTDNTLLQFFIKGEYECDETGAFRFILREKRIHQAYVSTYEPKYLMLCLDNNNDIKINSFLYAEKNLLEFKKPLNAIHSELAQMEHLDKIIVYNRTKAGVDGDWLVGYCKELITKQGLMLYKIGNEIIGTGEIRPDHRGKPYANIGMTVSKDYRRQDIGTYILSQMRILANKKDLKAICSTTKENIASQHTILKSGFLPYHRILTVKLI